jgi:cytochrome c-type biogenesis protein CcmH/NrfF
MSRRLAVLLLLLAACTAAAAPAARAAPPRTSLLDVEQDVMCVVCKTPLAVANGPQADDERAFIRALIARGKTKRQVEDALVAQYGERVLALPRDHGYNLAAYLVPIVAVAVALALLLLALPRWRRRSPASALGLGAAAQLSDEDARRLDEDLARYDG